MSEHDSFIQEVTEEVRQDRMFALWKKWGPFVLAGIVLVVAATAAWSWMQTRQHAQAEARGGALLAAEPGSLQAQQKLAEQMKAPAQLVPEFAVAAALARQGESAIAAEAYRSIAARGELAPAYRQMALLQAIRLEAATAADPKAALAELQPLMQPGAPYALLARELAAALHLKAGDRAAARAELEVILADQAATQNMRIRAREMMSVAAEPPEQAG